MPLAVDNKAIETGAISIAATPHFNADYFASKIGEKLNNAIDTVANELYYMTNPQSSRYM